MKFVGSKTHAGIGIRETRGWANAKKRPRDPEYRAHGAFSSEFSKILASGGDPGPLCPGRVRTRWGAVFWGAETGPGSVRKRQTWPQSPLYGGFTEIGLFQNFFYWGKTSRCVLTGADGP